MDVTNEYLQSVPLPATAWTYEIIENKPYYCIRNPVYANVFWTHYWYNVFAQLYKNQQMVTHLLNVDLTIPVIISENLKIISAPTSMQNIYYFSTLNHNYRPKFILNTSSFNVLSLYIVIMVIIIIGSLFLSSKFPKKLNINLV